MLFFMMRTSHGTATTASNISEDSTRCNDPTQDPYMTQHNIHHLPSQPTPAASTDVPHAAHPVGGPANPKGNDSNTPPVISRQRLCTNHKRIQDAYKAWFFLFYACQVSISPYLVLHYEKCGLTPTEVGFLLALQPWVSAPAGVLWSWIADRWGQYKLVMLVTLPLSLTFKASMVQGSTFLYFVVLVVATEVMGNAVMSLADTAAYTSCKKEGDYGKLRQWGAVGWGTFSGIAGIIVHASHGVKGALIIFWAMAIPCMLVTIFLPMSPADLLKAKEEDDATNCDVDKAPMLEASTSDKPSEEEIVYIPDASSAIPVIPAVREITHNAHAGVDFSLLDAAAPMADMESASASSSSASTADVLLDDAQFAACVPQTAFLAVSDTDLTEQRTTVHQTRGLVDCDSKVRQQRQHQCRMENKEWSSRKGGNTSRNEPLDETGGLPNKNNEMISGGRDDTFRNKPLKNTARRHVGTDAAHLWQMSGNTATENAASMAEAKQGHADKSRIISSTKIAGNNTAAHVAWETPGTCPGADSVSGIAVVCEAGTSPPSSSAVCGEDDDINVTESTSLLGAERQVEAEVAAVKKPNLGTLLSNPRVWPFLFLVGIIGFGTGVVSSFSFLMLDKLRAGSEMLMGLTLSINCLAEVPVFQFQTALFQVVNTTFLQHLVVVFTITCCLGWASMPWAPTPWLCLAVEFLRGAAFALEWGLGTLQGRRLTPKGMEATMQGLVQGMYYGVGGGLGSFVGGYLNKLYGFQGMFFITAVIVLVGWVIYTILEATLSRFYPEESVGTKIAQIAQSDSHLDENQALTAPLLSNEV